MRLAGDPILRSLRIVAAAGVHQVVVVAHPNWLQETQEIVAAAGLAIPVSVVTGGATRNESTANGVAALGADDDDVVLIHDAVRPLVPLEVILRSLEPVVAGRADSTDTVIPSADTLVIVEGEKVVQIPDRGRYRRGADDQAYDAAKQAGDLRATDDCSLVLRHVPGARIEAVDGDEIARRCPFRSGSS